MYGEQLKHSNDILNRDYSSIYVTVAHIKNGISHVKTYVLSLFLPYLDEHAQETKNHACHVHRDAWNLLGTI
ncbi:hypothetical protein Scep_030592 [Stephania cephalantha]|uniref:Uncharacterized protein n=1 Tax=Stephania cephalantha TaxID=152367 RepID=A0AAP0HH23_9MAGN